MWAERTGLTDILLKEIHSSIWDLKKTTGKKFKPKPKFEFVMSIVFKNVIWPELEVLQMKNNLALFSPFACRFPALSLVLAEAWR